jgi:hypothetical protein
MAPGQIITASLAAAAGARAAPHARALAATLSPDPMIQTGMVAGAGVALAVGGVMVHRNNEGKGYVGPAMVGFGSGLALGAVCDHFGF